MTHRNDLPTRPALRSQRLPVFLFFFLAAVFFFCQHDIFFTTNVTQGYDSSVDHVVSALDTGSVNRQFALAALGIFSIASLVRHRGSQLRIHGALGWIMLFYAGLAFASVVWADDTMLTLRRLMVFAALCSGAVVIARRFSLRHVVLWTFFTTGLYLLIGVVAEICLGTFRPFTSGYRFAGTVHPNGQGINCALFLLSGIVASDMYKHKKTVFRICALIGIVFLILTGSRTSFASGILGLAVYFGMVWSKRTKMVTVFAAFAIGVALWAPFVVAGGAALPRLENAAMLGRGNSKIDSFNGRSAVWENIGPYIDERPILGYGYGGFWNVRHVTEVTDATETLGTDRFGVAESHDAYLDCLLDLGFAGLAAFILILLGGLVRSVALYRVTQAPAFGFCGALLGFCLADGLLESAIVNSIFLTFLLMAVLIILGFRARPSVAGAM